MKIVIKIFSSNGRYFLEVGVQYPEKQHELHID